MTNPTSPPIRALSYSHMMPEDRDRARKAMEWFFARPDAGTWKTSGARDVP
jgi:hypothetical protein